LKRMCISSMMAPSLSCRSVVTTMLHRKKFSRFFALGSHIHAMPLSWPISVASSAQTYLKCSRTRCRCSTVLAYHTRPKHPHTSARTSRNTDDAFTHAGGRTTPTGGRRNMGHTRRRSNSSASP